MVQFPFRTWDRKTALEFTDKGIVKSTTYYNNGTNDVSNHLYLYNDKKRQWWICNLDGINDETVFSFTNNTLTLDDKGNTAPWGRQYVANRIFKRIK
ncbi:MAG: hypothetical protein LBS69_01230 [Prevotellaceae bacterium]|jgi:hypothetical protein|nr:hypothetical protein [Prevotellaceae bacterium]